jgi:2'-5' RNA ligase
MIRLFVGLQLPADVRAYLTLLRLGIRGARWQRDDQLHLTLQFIGPVDGATAQDIDTALVAVDMPRFSLAVSGVGVFGDLHAPRLLWAGVTPQDEVTRLHDKVGTQLMALGLKLEVRKYVPHITLARLSGGRQGASGARQFLESFDGAASRVFEVDRFVLFSSHPGNDGSIYRVEADYLLR